MSASRSVDEPLAPHFLTAEMLPAPPGLEEALHAQLQICRDAWPTIALAAPVFARHLGRHCPQGTEPLSYLASVHAPDLYLACACGQGNAPALAAFDRALLAKVPVYIGRLSAPPALVDEVKQTLREKLLVALPGALPKITEYSGGGTLEGWLRIAALRTALNLRRGPDEKAAAPYEEDLAAAVPVEKDAELGYLKQRYQRDFTDALRTAFRSLPREQRHVLRLHFAGGQTGEQIAGLLKINRATVVRWLASARTALFHEVRRLLRDRLRLTPAELDSLTALVRSQLDVNLSGLLRSESEQTVG